MFDAAREHSDKENEPCLAAPFIKLIQSYVPTVQ